MGAQEHIDRLDRSLRKNGEWVTLRRTVGMAGNERNIDVKCRAQVNAITLRSSRSAPGAIIGNITQTPLRVLISPTQINQAQWPGGTVEQQPPFDVDPRLPQVNTDKIIARGRNFNLEFVDPSFVDDILVRIEVWIG